MSELLEHHPDALPGSGTGLGSRPADVGHPECRRCERNTVVNASRGNRARSALCGSWTFNRLYEAHRFAVDKSGHDAKETKGRRKRSVPLVPAAWAIVSKRLEGRTPTSYVFTSPTGQQLHESNWKRSVRWPTTAMGRRVHDLRHTFATLALQGGIDVKTVHGWLGHASATLTLDLYGHFVATDADRAGLDRLTGVLESSGDTTGTRRRTTSVKNLPMDRRSS